MPALQQKSTDLRFRNAIAASFAQKRLQRKVEKTNASQKGVLTTSGISLSNLLPPDYPLGNAVISGGMSDIRERSVLPVVLNAYRRNIPVFVLHLSNTELEGKIRQSFGQGQDRLEIINQANPIFEPFAGLSKNEIGSVLIDSIPDKYDVKHKARYYLDGMADILLAKGKGLSLRSYASCPHFELFNKIDDMMNSGTIDDNTSNRIKSQLMAGQSENFKLESYFNSLLLQMQHIVHSPKSRLHSQGIREAVRKSKILVMDIHSNANNLLISLIVNLLSLELQSGNEIVLILDSIQLNTDNSIKNIIGSSTNRCKFCISTDDLLALLGGEDKKFAEVVGNCNKVVVHSHFSAISCEKWAEFFGQYDKKELSYSQTSGRTRYRFFQILPGRSTNNTVNVNDKREYIIKPEEISRLGYDEGIVYDGVLGRIIKGKIV